MIKNLNNKYELFFNYVQVLLFGHFSHVLSFFLVLLPKLLRFSIIFLVFICCLINNAVAKEQGQNDMDTIFDGLKNITCETEGYMDLLRTEFSHTCIPAPFFSFFVANIVSPVLYMNMFLRLNLHGDPFFPGACDRGNRVDFYDQKLSFSMCNNGKLIGARVKALGESVMAIAIGTLKNEDPWERVKDAWMLSKDEYHEFFIDKREGEYGVMFDLPTMGTPFIPWKVIRKNDKLCVATIGFGGWIPVGCKYIKEPYPESIYSDFIDLNPNSNTNPGSLTSCGNMGSCYKRVYENSRSAIVMTSPIIECVKEMIGKLMISEKVCSFDHIQNVLNSPTRYTSVLFQFQQNMHKAVSALLTIYVIFFGFKIVLSGKSPEKRELINFIIKFLFVVYFSVGININPGDETSRMDGMVQWVFPFFLNGMTQMASWIVNASPSGLCIFDDIDYPESLQYLKLWDALDCKISHYIGLDSIQTMIIDNASRSHDWSRLDLLSYPIPPYVYLIAVAVISGQLMLFSLAIMYPLLIISVAAFIVNATVVCMISIVILGVLAPIFVPLYLFKYTEGYFTSWVQLLISFLLQPMVAVVFMTTMMSVYDFGFYGSCKYKSMNLDNVVTNYRAVRYYAIDQDWSKYTDEEQESCRNSLGFMLNNPYQFFFDTGEDVVDALKMPWLDDPTGEEEKKRFGFLGAIKNSQGMFFNVAELIYEKIKTLIFSMLTACLILYLIYYLSESLSSFAADMTKGISLNDVSIQPRDITQAANYASNLFNKSGDMVSTGGRSEDAVNTGGARSKDVVNTGGGRSEDGLNTGGARSKDVVNTGIDDQK